MDSPFDCLHGALFSACSKDLPEIEFDLGRMGKNRRIPKSHECHVIMFPQTWGSTTLGYSGIGGNMMTPAYTTIVYFENYYCVYFGSGGVLAYRFDILNVSKTGKETFLFDIASQCMKHCADKGKYL